MKNLSKKQLKRLENKKSKLVALAELIKLKDKDSIATENTVKHSTECRSESDSSVEKETSPTMTPNRSEEEPKSKRVRLSSIHQGNNEEGIDGTVSSSDEFKLMAKQLTNEQYLQLKKEIRTRKKLLEDIPRFHLRPNGYKASLEVHQDKRTPIFLTDIQNLLMLALIGKRSPCSPERWCHLEKASRLSHTLIVVLEGVSLYHYLSNEQKFAGTNEIFETKLEVMLPKEGSIIQNLALASLTNAQAKELIDTYGCLETAMEMTKDPSLLVNSIFPVEEASNDMNNTRLPEGDKFPRTKLLLSALQMVDEGYPMPLRGELAQQFKDYVFTKDRYDPVTAWSPMFAIDCEMCKTSTGLNELTRISIVNEKYETVYETLVMPDNKIVDYLTQYSGITPELMKTVTKTLEEVQREVRELLPADAILVGQSLNSDLNAMKMMHPYVIDTSVIFNMTGQRKHKSKLQTLAMTFLDQTIQKNVTGHDSVEDSLASIRLVQLKLKNNLDFGDLVLKRKMLAHENNQTSAQQNGKNSTKRDTRTAIIKKGVLHDDIKKICDKSTSGDSLKSILYHETPNNKEAVKKAREVALENALNIVHLTIDPDKFQLDKLETTVNKIDKWITKLWKSIAHNGMFIVLMSGSEECPSGLLKVAIKKNIAQVPLSSPITV